jgi:hypothetical protein
VDPNSGLPLLGPVQDAASGFPDPPPPTLGEVFADLIVSVLSTNWIEVLIELGMVTFS